jgi:hypothetical protein
LGSALCYANRSSSVSSLEELAKKEDPKTSDVILQRNLLVRDDFGEWQTHVVALTKFYISYWREGEEEESRRDTIAVLSPCKIITPMDRPHTFAIFQQSDIHYFAAACTYSTATLGRPPRSSPRCTRGV